MNLIRILYILILSISFPAFANEAKTLDQAETESMKINDLIIKNRNKFALLYFVQPGCVYCQQQQPVINEFQKDTNWYVKTIDIIQNPEVRTKFNINGTPVIVLIKRNTSANNWQTVSIGYSPLSTLRSDLYKLIRLFNGQEPQGSYYVPVQRNESTPIR